MTAMRQVSVSLTERTLDRVEGIRRKTHRSRSEVIAQAVEQFVERQEETPPPMPVFDLEPMSLEEQKRVMLESMERRAAKR